MTELLLIGALLSGDPAPGDTTVALRRGDRVVVEQLSGELIIRGWTRSELEARGGDEEGAAVVVDRSGGRVRVRPDDRKGRSHSHDLTLMVPAWAEIEVRGRELEVTVDGVDGGLDIATVDGEVSVNATNGPVRVRTVEGEIYVSRARGNSVVARSEGDDIVLVDVSGDVEVESGSGDIRLENIDSRSVRAETLDGDIEFDGPLHPGGTYSFYVHDGDAVLGLRPDVSARVSVSTFDGEFTSDFPVRVERFSGGRAFDFVLGDGAAALQVEVFDGEIRLVRRR